MGCLENSLWYHFYTEGLPQKKQNKKLKIKNLNECFNFYFILLSFEFFLDNRPEKTLKNGYGHGHRILQQRRLSHGREFGLKNHFPHFNQYLNCHHHVQTSDRHPIFQSPVFQSPVFHSQGACIPARFENHRIKRRGRHVLLQGKKRQSEF